MTLILAACGRPAARRPAPESITKKLPLPTRIATMPNGLRVILQEDHRSAMVAVEVVYRVGSSADPPGRSGFAHLFEHFMFEGSAHVPRGAFDTLLERAGGTSKNATTTHDATSYFEVVPANQLELALFLESDRMGFLLPALDQSAFENVRAVVKNEMRQRVENVPYGFVRSAVEAVLFPKAHPYHRAPIGTPAELDAATLDDVRQFFLRWYGPNNATLILVGDIDAELVLSRIHHWFDAIPASPPPPALPALPAVILETERTLVFEAGVTLPRLVMTWSTPAYGAPGEVGLASAAELLDWRAAGHLIKTLEIAHSVGVEHRPGRFGGTVTLQATLRIGVAPEKARLEVQSAMDDMSRFARYTMDDEAVHSSLYGIYADGVFDLDGVLSRAHTYGFFDLVRGTADAIPERLRAYESLQSGDVIDAFRTYILRAPPVTALVRPKKDAPQAGVLVEEH